MTWTLSVPPTARDDFAAAVDAAEASGQDLALPGVVEDVAAGRSALKVLGARVKRPFVAGHASGHALQEGEGPGWSDSVGANAYGVEEASPS